MTGRFEGKAFALNGLPVIAGTSSGYLLAQELDPGITYTCCGVLCAMCVLFIIFLSLRQNSALCVILLFLCGTFAAFCSSLPGISGGPPSPRPAVFCVTRLRGVIDSLPFENPRSNALLKAFLTADRSSMTYSDRALFRNSGASHLLALSGMHVGIIYLFIDKLFSLSGNTPASKKARSLVSIISIGFFCLMAGCGPSITRAFLFILLRETARMLHRNCSLSTCLSGALCIQLILSPSSIMEAGFQLSYLAMIGITFIYPSLEKLYPSCGQIDPIRKLWEMAAMSISCQLMTAPVVFLRFHTFAHHFLLTNILAAPLMTAAMITGITATAMSACGICPDFIIWAGDRCCRILYFVLETISAL